MSELRYVYYTDRSIAVYGDREKYEKFMKGMGRWNSRLDPMPGWIIPKINEGLLLKTLESLNQPLEPDTEIDFHKKKIPSESNSPKEPRKTKPKSKPNIESETQEPVTDTQQESAIKTKKVRKPKAKPDVDVQPEACQESEPVNYAEQRAPELEQREIEPEPLRREEGKKDVTREMKPYDVKMNMTPHDVKLESRHVDTESDESDHSHSDSESDHSHSDSNSDSESDHSHSDSESESDRSRSSSSSSEEDYRRKGHRYSDDEDEHKKIRNPKEKISSRSKDIFIDKYVNSDDEVDPEESKKIMQKYQKLFTYFKAFAEKPENFDLEKVRKMRSETY